MHMYVFVCMTLYLYVSSDHRSCIQCICACMSGIYSRHTCTYIHICIPEEQWGQCISVCMWLHICMYFNATYMLHTALVAARLLRACCALAARLLCVCSAVATRSPRGHCTSRRAVVERSPRGQRMHMRRHFANFIRISSITVAGCNKRASVAHCRLNWCLGIVDCQWFMS